MTNSNKKSKNSKDPQESSKNEVLYTYSLQELEQRMRNDPLDFSSKHLKQKIASLAQKKLRALFWGNRCGKTEWGAMEVAEVMLGRHKFIKPCDVWSFCPSFDEQKDTTQLKLLRYIPQRSIVDTTWLRKGIIKELVVQAEDGSRHKITFKSYEQGRDKAQGAGKGLIRFDEEPPKDIFDECSVRQEAGVPLYIIMTMTPINGMCFDDQTKLLARDGWKGIDDLHLGDEIFTINKDTQDLELKKVDFIYKEKNKGPMIRMTAQGFDSFTTSDHRWYVKNNATKKYIVRETKDLKTHHSIPRAMKNNYDPEPIHEDWYVALIGWIVTDGTYRRDRSQVVITQSVSKNKAKCDTIEDLLKQSKCDLRIDDVYYHKGEPCEGKARNYCIKKDLAKRIIHQFPNKEITGEFISSLSKKQQKILFDSMIGGDGSTNKNGIRFVSEDKYMGNIEGMMMLTQLLGLRCTISKEKNYRRLHIQTSKTFKPFTHVSCLKRNAEEYTGRIWCPHTENETVIAMRNGTSYVSMNTWVYDQIYLNTSNPDIFVSEASWKDNPWLTEEQINEMRRRLTPQALKVREEGKFVKQVGLVASWFQRTVHVVDMKNALPPGDTYLAIDFGFSAPCAGLYVRVDRENNVWIFDGWYRRGMTNPDIQRIIALKEAGIGRVHRIGDSAQASDIKQLTDNGVEISGVVKQSGSKESWDEYRARLMEQYGQIQEATNKPKIFISTDLVDVDDNPKSATVGSPFNFLVAELENLRWEESKTDIGIDQKSIWGKQANHAVDALTYILVSIAPATEQYIQPMQAHGGIQPLDPSLGMF